MFNRALLGTVHVHAGTTHNLTVKATSRTLNATHYTRLSCRRNTFDSLTLILYKVVASLVTPFLFPVVLTMVNWGLQYITRF